LQKFIDRLIFIIRVGEGDNSFVEGAIKRFNPTTKRVTLRHSLKCLPDAKPISTTFIIPVEDYSTSIPPLDRLAVSDDDEFSFTNTTINKALARYKFGFKLL
jgi:hypothetical protein